MDISPTDNGGRRVDGERRLISVDNFRIERRLTPDRRLNVVDKRAKNYYRGDHPERRAIDLFFREKFRFPG